MWIYKYNLLSCCHLGLDNLSGISSLKKTNFPSLRSHELPGPLHLGVGPCEISPCTLGCQLVLSLLKCYLGRHSLLITVCVGTRHGMNVDVRECPFDVSSLLSPLCIPGIKLRLASLTSTSISGDILLALNYLSDFVWALVVKHGHAYLTLNGNKSWCRWTVGWITLHVLFKGHF